MRGFVEVKWDVVTEQTDGEGETGYAAAADGYCEGFVHCRVGGRVDHGGW